MAALRLVATTICGSFVTIETELICVPIQRRLFTPAQQQVAEPPGKAYFLNKSRGCVWDDFFEISFIIFAVNIGSREYART